MQSPITVFDHVNKTVTVVARGANDKKVNEVLAAQHNQITSSGGSPAR